MVPPIALWGWPSRTLPSASCDSACRIEYPPIGSPESPPGSTTASRSTQVDDRVAGLLRPGHPGLHPRLGLFRRALGHLLLGRHARPVEHQVLRHVLLLW